MGASGVHIGCCLNLIFKAADSFRLVSRPRGSVGIATFLCRWQTAGWWFDSPLVREWDSRPQCSCQGLLLLLRPRLRRRPRLLPRLLLVHFSCWALAPLACFAVFRTVRRKSGWGICVLPWFCFLVCFLFGCYDLASFMWPPASMSHSYQQLCLM